MSSFLRNLSIFLLCAALSSPVAFAQGRHGGNGGGRIEQPSKNHNGNSHSSRGGQSSRPSRGHNNSSSRPNIGNGGSNRPNRPNIGNGGNNHRPNRPDVGNGNNNHRPNRPDVGNGNNNHHPNRPDVGNGNNNHRPNRPDAGNGNNNHRPNRPDVGNGNNNHRPNRPNIGNNHRPGHDYRPGLNPGHNRPGNNHGFRPGGNHHGPRPPMMKPPHRPYRPIIHRPHYRPMPPRGWRPARPLPIIRGILGLTFGTAINLSLDYLFNNGYTVDGYTNDIVYLRNVPALNYIWTDAALYYGNSGLDASSFYYSTPVYDLTRYNSVYNSLVATYGVPVAINNTVNTMSATWFGGNNGYITLSFGANTMNSRLRYLTTLTFGL